MKQIKLNLNNKDVVLDVGKWAFTKYYGEVSGSDPLNTTDILLSPSRQFDFVVYLVYAGLRTWYDVQQKEPDFSKEDVVKWVGLLEDDEVGRLIDEYSGFKLKKAEPGEAEAQAVLS